MFQRKHLPRSKLYGPLGCTEADSPFEGLDRDSAFSSMFLQAPAFFDNYQHHTEIGIFGERLCCMSRLPASFGSQLRDLAVKVQRQERRG